MPITNAGFNKMIKQTDFISEIEKAQPFVAPRKQDVLVKIRGLVSMHRQGLLGGESMPEDANPGMEPSKPENYLFFTLPMALNYQRNSYALWLAATKAFRDKDTRFIFDPFAVVKMPLEETRAALLKHKVALQPIKHTDTWTRICKTLCDYYDGDVRKLLQEGSFSVAKIKSVVQGEKKAGFPYLSGQKICNYWLYVLEQYTDAKFIDREQITVAPDTHVIQASFQLGLLPTSLKEAPNIQELVANAWNGLLTGTEFVPIDIHTPLWLWSRSGFPKICK